MSGKENGFDEGDGFALATLGGVDEREVDRQRLRSGFGAVVFLNLFVDLPRGPQAGGGAVRTDARGGHANGPVEVIGQGSVPWGMALGRATLAALLGIADRLAIGFETGSVLSLETSAQFRVLLFQTLVIRFQGGVLFADARHIVTIAKTVMVVIGEERIGPSGGHAAEVGTGVPIRTFKTVGSFFRAPHSPGEKRVGGATAS